MTTDTILILTTKKNESFSGQELMQALMTEKEYYIYNLTRFLNAHFTNLI